MENGNCVESCSKNYQLVGNECQKCHDNCETCIGSPVYYPNNELAIIQMKCKSCSENFIQVLDMCFEKIENNEIVQFNASIYYSPNKSNCYDFNKMGLLNNKCIEKPENYYFINKYGKIEECPKNCSKCFLKNEKPFCVQCQNNYNLFKGDCIETCPQGYDKNNKNEM